MQIHVRLGPFQRQVHQCVGTRVFDSSGYILAGSWLLRATSRQQPGHAEHQDANCQPPQQTEANESLVRPPAVAPNR